MFTSDHCIVRSSDGARGTCVTKETFLFHLSSFLEMFFYASPDKKQKEVVDEGVERNGGSCGFSFFLLFLFLKVYTRQGFLQFRNGRCCIHPVLPFTTICACEGTRS